MAKLCEVSKYHLCQKFDILAEKAKNSEDIRVASVGGTSSIQVAPPSQRGRRSGVGWLGQTGCLKALSSAIGGRGRTSFSGSCTLTGHRESLFLQLQQKKQTQSLAKPCQHDALFLRECFAAREFESVFMFVPRDMPERFFPVLPRVAKR